MLWLGSVCPEFLISIGLFVASAPIIMFFYVFHIKNACSVSSRTIKSSTSPLLAINGQRLQAELILYRLIVLVNRELLLVIDADAYSRIKLFLKYFFITFCQLLMNTSLPALLFLLLFLGICTSFDSLKQLFYLDRLIVDLAEV